MSQILTINAGSSSLKYAVFKVINNSINKAHVSGVIERIGQSSQTIQHSFIRDSKEEKLLINKTRISTHENALKFTLNLLNDSSLSNENHVKDIPIICHRVVHGGPHLTKAQLVSKDVLTAIKEAIPLAPLHNPHNLNGIQTALNVFPSSVKHVVEFDTSFHSTIPHHARLYGLPLNLYKQYHIRKYGFHGISHEYVAKKAADLLGKPLQNVNLITCHLGSGSSVTCIENGKSIDTSMGFTPLEGLIMSTRGGDVDSGVIFYLAKEMKMPFDEIEEMFLQRSGMYGLTGYKDARDLHARYILGDENSVLTLNAMAHRIRKYIGAFHLNLACKTDAIVFTAGMGENWPTLRLACMKFCDSFGFVIDKALNEKSKFLNEPVDISHSHSPRKIFVIPTDEERNLAEKALLVCSANSF